MQSIIFTININMHLFAENKLRYNCNYIKIGRFSVDFDMNRKYVAEPHVFFLFFIALGFS